MNGTPRGRYGNLGAPRYADLHIALPNLSQPLELPGERDDHGAHDDEGRTGGISADLHVAVISVAEDGHGPLVVPIWYSYEPGGEVRIPTHAGHGRDACSYAARTMARP